MGGVPSKLIFRPRTANVVYISNPVVHFEFEENFLKFYGMMGEEPLAVFLADYIFICEKLLLGLTILYYSPVTSDCTTYCFTSFNNQMFLTLSEALNEYTFRGNYSERTLHSEEICQEQDQDQPTLSPNTGSGTGSEEQQQNLLAAFAEATDDNDAGGVVIDDNNNDNGSSDNNDHLK